MSFAREAAVRLKRFPILKKILKYGYQRFVWVFNRSATNVISNHKINVVAIEDQETFFGYYDKSPESDCGNILVCSTTASTKTHPRDVSSIRISVVDRKTGQTLCSVSTKAFNWQQGARAAWISEDIFVYNDYAVEEDKYVCCVYSVSQDRIVRRYGYPVQDIFRDRFFLSINYDRLTVLNPDYGYFCRKVAGFDGIRDLSNDGIRRVDFFSGDDDLLVSLAGLAEDTTGIGTKIDGHSVNHVMIAPNGDRFIFLHRMVGKGIRYDRLFSYDMTSRKYSLISSSELISHSCWLDNKHIVTYLKNSTEGIGYWKINVEDGSKSLVESITTTGLGDGHPSVNGNLLITDSYPDKSRMQHLILLNLLEDRTTTLGRFLHSFEYSNETRCDLHPRLSPAAERAYFDSVHSGRRQLCFIELR